jgi:hypothetical protein
MERDVDDDVPRMPRKEHKLARDRAIQALALPPAPIFLKTFSPLIEPVVLVAANENVQFGGQSIATKRRAEVLGSTVLRARQAHNPQVLIVTPENELIHLARIAYVRCGWYVSRQRLSAYVKSAGNGGSGARDNPGSKIRAT